MIENIEPTFPIEEPILPSGSSDEDKAAVLAQYPNTIDNACAKIMARICRFAMEYELRESQAKAYAAAGYTGVVPRQVIAFATRAGLDARVATDIILGQAISYRAALEDLGDLRMRKFELAGMDMEMAQATFVEISAQIDALDRSLT